MAKYTRKDEDPVVMAHKGYQSILEKLDPGSSPKIKGKDPVAVAMGKRGGIKGGKARAEKLTSDERRAIAKRAAKARWAKRS